ncbi:AKAP8 protein, partial [Origma solitaria]|nr:AKAP8 protein [Origma solitaria]
GHEGYDYYTPQSSAPTPPGSSYSYGGGAPSASWETPKAPELTLGSAESSGTFGSEALPAENSDSIIAKINQRLDLLSKEGAASAGDGGEEQESSFRFASFSPFPSRSALPSDRDPFRSSFPENSRNSRGGAFGILRGNNSRSR